MSHWNSEKGTLAFFPEFRIIITNNLLYKKQTNNFQDFKVLSVAW